MPIHVSIHDVAPSTASEVELALEFCGEAGVKPALLVVPNLHGTAPLLDAPKFCNRLRALQEAGHEVFLHGFFHASRGTGETSLRSVFAQRVASSGEAEFAELDRREAVRRLDDGEAIFRHAGLRIDGFVAPAWLSPSWLRPVLAARAYGYTEDHFRIYDLGRGLARTSVVLNYASRSPGRLFSTVGYCRLARVARGWVPVRLAIHPGDMRVALLRSEVRKLLAWGRGDFVPRATALFG
ncbi:MAG: polysaccharide deacetylase family protein [Myxococcales bacterium]